MKVIDLYSGLGGFSQAFVDRGHDVIRVDNDARFIDVPYTIMENVHDIEGRNLKNLTPDIILASPPCQHFSIAAVGKHWKGGDPTTDTKYMILLVKHTIKIIKEAAPKYWMLENPRGMLRKVIGRPEITTYWGAWGAKWLKPTDIWGVFPPIDWKSKDCATWEKAPRGSKKGIQGQMRDPAKRSLIPYDFSMAVCLAAEGNSQQRTLV